MNVYNSVYTADPTRLVYSACIMIMHDLRFLIWRLNRSHMTHIFTNCSAVIYTILFLIPLTRALFSENQWETKSENNRQASWLNTSHVKLNDCRLICDYQSGVEPTYQSDMKFHAIYHQFHLNIYFIFYHTLHTYTLFWIRRHQEANQFLSVVTHTNTSIAKHV